MSFTYKGNRYKSKKHVLLEYIFMQKNPYSRTDVGPIRFTLQDITRAYDALGISKPSSVSNTILDLLRKNRGIEARMPQSLIDLGFDLRRKTGVAESRENYAGEFVFVGLGGSYSSWLVWPERDDREITIPSSPIPAPAISILSNDEAALFSVLDHCDVLSIALKQQPKSILRVQNPLKLQPNEVDGFYVSNGLPSLILFPVEAKGLSTGDDINTDQLRGGVQVCVNRFAHLEASIEPLAISMLPTGMRIAEFEAITTANGTFNTKIKRSTRVNLQPPIPSWI